MQLDQAYATIRRRLLDLAPTLSEEQAGRELRATPPWTAVDGYRHLAGVCADVVDGAMDGGGTPEWTATQLAERADRTLAEVCAEWEQRGPELEAVIGGAGAAMGFTVLDVWTHEQDIRAATGVGACRDDPLLPGLVNLALGAFDRFYAKRGGPPLQLVIDGDERVVGGDDPTIALDTSAYELMRIIFGRRSEAQIAAAAWSGQSDTAQAAFHLFDPPPVDIAD